MQRGTPDPVACHRPLFEDMGQNDECKGKGSYKRQEDVPPSQRGPSEDQTSPADRDDEYHNQNPDSRLVAISSHPARLTGGRKHRAPEPTPGVHLLAARDSGKNRDVSELSPPDTHDHVGPSRHSCVDRILAQ